MIIIISLAFIGFCVSAYAYFVERKVKHNPQYKPVCDINDWISCSKPAKSSYANVFLISNALLGMMFYATVSVLALLQASQLLVAATVCGCAVSVVLAYILYFKVKSLCVLCTLLYFINVVLLMLSLRNGA